MNVSTRISPTESMMDGNLNRYLSVGESAIKAVRSSLAGYSPKSILDLPCGHGRVARFLKAEYPQASLFVSDLDDVGANFCAEVFDATKLVSAPHFDDVDFGRKFDLIWVGSLVTHLPEKETVAFLRFIKRHLSSDGRAIVTVHGTFVAGRLFGSAKAVYGLTVDEERGIFSDYLTNGYGYRSYRGVTDYGISVIAKPWLERETQRCGLSIYKYTDHEWDNHQDVMSLNAKSAS